MIKKNHFIFYCFLAVSLRLLCTYAGAPIREHNWDLNVWEIVTDIVLNGDNVYEHTHRYPYGPVWFHILAALKLTGIDFPFALALFLSAMDILIALILFRRKNHVASLFFLFSPISIAISGFHLQFDNMAVLIGLAGIAYIESRASYSKREQIEDLSVLESLIFSLIIGFSLATKHILFVFPLWMFFKTTSIKQKIIFLAVPVAAFLISFTPYMAEGFEGIKNNVFNFRGSNNAPFYNVFAPQLINMIGYKLNMIVGREIPRLLFFTMMILSGIILRKKKVFESYMFYLPCLVAFSSNIHIEYMAIPVLFTAMYRNVFNVLFNIFGLACYVLFFFIDSPPTIISIKEFVVGRHGIFPYVIMLLLLCGLLQALFGKRLWQFAVSAFNECAEAIGLYFLVKKKPGS